MTWQSESRVGNIRIRYSVWTAELHLLYSLSKVKSSATVNKICEVLNDLEFWCRKIERLREPFVEAPPETFFFLFSLRSFQNPDFVLSYLVCKKTRLLFLLKELSKMSKFVFQAWPGRLAKKASKPKRWMVARGAKNMFWSHWSRPSTYLSLLGRTRNGCFVAAKTSPKTWKSGGDTEGEKEI